MLQGIDNVREVSRTDYVPLSKNFARRFTRFFYLVELSNATDIEKKNDVEKTSTTSSERVLP